MSVFASEPHYARHAQPILEALPWEIRGEVHTQPESVPPGPVIVAGYRDALRMAARDLIFVEHGAGQTYGDSADSRSYPGSVGVAFDSVRLFICPSARVATAWTRVYPTPCVIVGDPTLDAPLRRPPAAQPDPCVVAISFHYDADKVCPEARSALRQYLPHLPDIVGELRSWGWIVLGHSHPRAESLARTMWAGLSVPFVSIDEIWDRAAVYCVDNSCVSPDTPVLTADLTWRPAGELRPGDEVIACDEENTRKGRSRRGIETDREDRRLRTATVLRNKVEPRPCVEVQTTHGTLIVSAAHPWLARRQIHYRHGDDNRSGSHERWDWVESTDLVVGDRVAYLTDPWQREETHEAGWLGGMFDGEGCVHVSAPSALGSRRSSVSIAQNPGPVLDRLIEILDRRRLGYTDQKVTSRRCRKLTIGGRTMDKIGFLATIGANRLLDKIIATRAWEGLTVTNNVEQARITAIRDLGDQPVAVLSTDTQTFVAGGFMAHNSTLYEAAALGKATVAMNCDHYRKDVHHGLRFWDQIPGAMIDGPADLVAAIRFADQQDPEVRRRVAEEVYGSLDGRAAERAASAILAVLL